MRLRGWAPAIVLPLVLSAAPGQADPWPLVHADSFAGAPQGEGGPQDPESWEGDAPAVPLSGAALSDVHEFDVLGGNDRATVTIAWTRGPVAYDLNLDVDRQSPDGAWTSYDFSTLYQVLDYGEPSETVVLPSPAPGRYRTRVTNRLSTEVRYRGSVVYTAWAEQPVPQARATQDRPDVVSGPSLHVVYFVPADRPDEELDTSGILETAMLGLNAWVARETGGRRLRLDVYEEAGTPRADVSFVRGLRNASEYDSAGSVIGELNARGFTKVRARNRYVVYADAPLAPDPVTLCGLATGQWAFVSLVFPPCRARNFGGPSAGAGPSEVIVMHELLHTFGAVDLLAPHHCAEDRAHLCTVGLRALRNADPEFDDPMFNSYPRPLAVYTLDEGHDDYYGHSGSWPDVADVPFLES